MCRIMWTCSTKITNTTKSSGKDKSPALDTTRTAYETKELVWGHRHTGSLFPSIHMGETESARRSPEIQTMGRGGEQVDLISLVKQG